VKTERKVNIFFRKIQKKLASKNMSFSSWIANRLVSTSALHLLAMSFDVSIGLLYARLFHALCFWCLSLDAIPFGAWLYQYLSQDLLFYLSHFGYHNPAGPLGPLLPRLLLPFHATHHGRQNLWAYFSNAMLESGPMMCACALWGFWCFGVPGSVSAVAQQINTNYVVHIAAHMFRSVHHMRHHAAPTRANFGSECSLWDMLFQTYDGFTMGFNVRLHSDPYPGWTKRI